MDKLFLFFVLLFFIACGNPQSTETAIEETENSTPSATTETPTAAATQNASQTYPTLPTDKAEELFTKTDYMDYVFYDLPFSMNHSKTADIQNSIRYISTSPVNNTIPQCASIGRIFYQSKGEIIGEAEFHFNNEQNCYYMIFLEEGKPKYANLLTETGVRNYSNIFAQVKK